MESKMLCSHAKKDHSDGLNSYKQFEHKIGDGFLQYPLICRFSLDTTELREQVDDFADLLVARFPDGIPELLIEDFLHRDFEYVFTNFRSATGADGITEITQSFRMGSNFEVFKAAALAGDWDKHVGQLLVAKKR